MMAVRALDLAYVHLSTCCLDAPRRCYWLTLCCLPPLFRASLFPLPLVAKAPPVKLSSLTYLSFHLERLVMHSTADLQSPFITISVHDSRGRRVRKRHVK